MKLQIHSWINITPIKMSWKIQVAGIILGSLICSYLWKDIFALEVNCSIEITSNCINKYLFSEAKYWAIALSIPACARAWLTRMHFNLVLYVWMILTANKWQQNDFEYRIFWVNDQNSIFRDNFWRNFWEKYFEDKFEIHILKKNQQLH